MEILPGKMARNYYRLDPSKLPSPPQVPEILNYATSLNLGMDFANATLLLVENPLTAFLEGNQIPESFDCDKKFAQRALARICGCSAVS
jgi:hypothetical protein